MKSSILNFSYTKRFNSKNNDTNVTLFDKNEILSPLLKHTFERSIKPNKEH